MKRPMHAARFLYLNISAAMCSAARYRVARYRVARCRVAMCRVARPLRVQHSRGRPFARELGARGVRYASASVESAAESQTALLAALGSDNRPTDSSSAEIVAAARCCCLSVEAWPVFGMACTGGTPSRHEQVAHSILQEE